MKLIKQEDDTGCGLACVSILTGLEYRVVRCIAKEYGLHLKKHDGLYTTTNHLIELAKKIGLFSISSKKRRKFTCIDDLPDKAILSIGYKETIKEWHWVVFERINNGNVYIYDPEIPRKHKGKNEINKLNITHYLPIKT